MFIIVLLLLFAAAIDGHTVPLNAVDRVLGDGYPIEIHDVTTEDDYILQVHRIPYSPLNGAGFKTKGVVFMQHGFIANSDNFILHGPGQALAYMISDAGYDVWLGNFRGNTYSRRHVFLNPNIPGPFWNFGPFEYGYYDVAAMLNYILKTTSREQLHYIGHSMGTMAFFMLTSERPEFNSKIISANILAPQMFAGDIDLILAKLGCPFLDRIGSTLLGNFEILQHSKLLGEFLAQVCDINSPVLPLCAEAMNVFAGLSSNFNASLYAGLYATNPAGTSIKAAQHNCQLIKFDEFRKFDYGSDKNIRTYGTPTPPHFKLENVNVDLYFYRGTADPYIPATDFQRVLDTFKNVTKGVTYLDKGLWAHNDYLFGNNVQTILNPIIIERIDSYHKD